MTDTKHTPGPWMIDPRAANNITNKDDRGICSISYSDGTTRTREENRANARLIAAAPQMLEALKSCVQMFGEEDNWTTVIKARAAIAAAEKE